MMLQKKTKQCSWFFGLLPFFSVVLLSFSSEIPSDAKYQGFVSQFGTRSACRMNQASIRVQKFNNDSIGLSWAEEGFSEGNKSGYCRHHLELTLVKNGGNYQVRFDARSDSFFNPDEWTFRAWENGPDRLRIEGEAFSLVGKLRVTWEFNIQDAQLHFYRKYEHLFSTDYSQVEGWLNRD